MPGGGSGEPAPAGEGGLSHGQDRPIDAIADATLAHKSRNARTSLDLFHLALLKRDAETK